MFYLHLSSLVVLAVVIVVLFVIRKIKKRRQVSALNIPELHDDSTKTVTKEVGDGIY